MMIRLRWILLMVVTALPAVLLLLAGLLWLWQQDYLMAWLGLSAIVALASWLISRYLQQSPLAPKTLQVAPEQRWSAAGQRAWTQVERLAREASQREIEDWRELWDLLREVLELVARQFHPEQRDPVLELKLPYLLRVVELLSRDLRQALTDHVPGSHIFSVNDMLRGHRLALQGRQLYNLYRLVSFGVNPVSAAIREAKGLAWEKLLESSATEIRGWLLDAYVKKIGYYAIELYSGNLTLEDMPVEQPTPSSQADLQKLQALQDRVQEEPLRVLILGQVKAGKSSLVNALFGETRALTDVLPETPEVTPYLLERDGLERAIILDTAGYEESDRGARALIEAQQEVLRSDLILVVCAATSAARQADRALLDQLRQQFLDATGEEPPPIIAVLSQIDRLRPPREWQPPYDIAKPTGTKAQNIRGALEAVAEDLEIPVERVVPVCLREGQIYNIDEGLIPTILLHLDAAQRLKYLRCLKSHRDQEYWGKLWTQAQNSGRLLVSAGIRWLDRRVDELIGPR